MEVQEWLGHDNQLGIDIWNKKYRFENETLDQFFDRVSGGNEKAKQLIISKKFLPAGRILANRGLDKLGRKITLSNCFVAGSKVITKRGLINIEDVQVGDFVITDNNTWQKVNYIMPKEYEGDLFKIQTHHMFEPIICTPNHKFLTNEGWVRADRLVGINMNRKYHNSCHSLKTPTIKFETELFELRLSDFINTDQTTTIEFLDDDMVCTNTKFIGGNGANGNKKSGLIKNTFVINEDVQYLIGRYLGDGSTTSRKGVKNNSIFQIVFNANNEQDSFHRCAKIIENTFKIVPILTQNDKQHTLILRVENPFLGEFFAKYCGKGSTNKRIPIQLLGSLDVILGLLDSDGAVLKDQKIKLVLNNKNLLDDIRVSLLLNGIISSEVTQIKQSLSNEIRTYSAYHLYISQGFTRSKLLSLLNKKYDDNRMNLNKTVKPLFTKLINNEVFVNVEDVIIIENQKTLVYNISIENVHSYTVNGFVVHNCYVLDQPEDSIESLFDTASKLARTYSYGGGVGLDISKLSPRGAKINNAAKETTGAVSFMELYSMVTGLIGQNGRRGALMISLDCNHPDLEEFIELKSDLDKVTKANISIKITDDFMNSVIKNKPFKLSFIREQTGEVIEKIVDAKSLFSKIAKMNWEMAEPGFLFWSRIKNWNLLSEDSNFAYAGVNP